MVAVISNAEASDTTGTTEFLIIVITIIATGAITGITAIAITGLISLGFGDGTGHRGDTRGDTPGVGIMTPGTMVGVGIIPPILLTKVQTPG